MGTFVVPNVAAIWDYTVLVRQVERGAESWDMKDIQFIYDFDSQLHQGCTIALYCILFPIS